MVRSGVFATAAAGLALVSTVPAEAQSNGASPSAGAKKPLKEVRQLSTPRHGIFEAVAPVQSAAMRLQLKRPAAQAAGEVPGFYVDSQFQGLTLVETIALGSGAIPPDMGGAANADYVLQIVNGGVAIFNHQGKLLSKLETDSRFWIKAGISPKLVNIGVSDPRIYWDAASQRFFVTQINVDTPNSIFIAVSNTANPLEGFRAVPITVKGPILGDFPTLGVNANAVTVSTNNFGAFGFVSLSVFSVPKADLLAPEQSLAGLARFDALDPASYGFAVHAVSTQNQVGVNQTLLGVSATAFNELNISDLTKVGTPRVAITPPTIVPTRFDGSPLLGRQPGGTDYDNSDDRISSDIKQVGDYIYFTNVAAPKGDAVSSNYVHWGIIDAKTKKIVIEGTVRDPARKIDYSYPAIDANRKGRFVIGYNGSSSKSNISTYATICDFDKVAVKVTCTAPKLMTYGPEANYDLGAPGRVRWGDYNVVQVDPVDPKAFWLFQEVPGPRQLNSEGVPRTRWATVITHLVTQ